MTVPPTERTSYAGRLQSAAKRYGVRAVAVVAYRVFFQWPRLRSQMLRLKISLLLKSEIASTVTFGKHTFITVPGGFLAIGDRTRIGDRCVIEVSPNPYAEVRIASNCFFAHDVHLGAYRQIEIGHNVRVAEFTSLRDSSHKYEDRTTPINQQGDIVGRLIVEDDVWIGQGCLVLGSAAGTVIGKGAVIGAHSVVKESVPDYAIAVGAPARVIGFRKATVFADHDPDFFDSLAQQGLQTRTEVAVSVRDIAGQGMPTE